jgi:hypothetical protein
MLSEGVQASFIGHVLTDEGEDGRFSSVADGFISPGSGRSRFRAIVSGVEGALVNDETLKVVSGCVAKGSS